MTDLDQLALDTVEAIAKIDPDKLKGGRVQAMAQAQCLVRDALRGVAAERDALVNRVDFLNQQNSAQQEQNDELAAHVERLFEVWVALTSEDRTDVPTLIQHVDDVFVDGPTSSLAHLIAEKQADAVSEFASRYLGGHEQELAEIYAGKLRRQAEGAEQP